MHPTRFPLPFLFLFLALAGARASLTAPFEPAPPTRPLIPATSVRLTDFGAVGDGATLNTQAFADAIAALERQGGGTLVVPPGIWLTGPVVLRSRTCLHVEAGAVIQFSRDHTLYPLRIFDARGEKSVHSQSPLSAEHAEDIAITGAGIIDGGGDAWRLIKKEKVTERFWRDLVASGGVLNDRQNQWWPSQAALDGNTEAVALEAAESIDLAAYAPYHQFLRPRLLRFLDCRRVLIQGVIFRNAPNWTLHPWLCEDVTIEAVKVFNAHWAQNSDGMDLDSCRRAVVRHCIVDTGDDGICLKSGMNASGRRLGVPTEDVLVEDCVVYEAHGGLTIGSEMSGGVRRVLARNLTFIGTDLGLRFKTARGRGGVVEDIHLQDIRMLELKGEAISFNFFYAGAKDQSAPPPPVTEETPIFRHILFERILARGSERSITIRGLPEMPIQDLTFRDVLIASTTGAELMNATRIRFDGVRLDAEKGPALRSDAVTDSHLELTGGR